MKLNFEIHQVVESGENPNLVHFWDGKLQLFYVKDGQLFSKISRAVENDWDDLEFLGERRLLEHESRRIENFELIGLYGNTIIGSYTTGDEQKMFVYEY